MAKATLATDYTDDILDSSMGDERRYSQTTNSDGTITLTDATTYTQVGSVFGASDINATNAAVNASADASKIIDDLSTVESTTESGYMAGALAVKELSNSIGDGTITITQGGTTKGTFTVNQSGDTTIALTDNNTDTKVTNTLATTTKAYVTGTTSSATNTGTQVFDTGVYLDTTAGQLTATTFKGALSGNATSATKATQDGSGNTITSTYLKLSGGTMNDNKNIQFNHTGSSEVGVILKKGGDNVASFAIGEGGTNAGIYDKRLDKWALLMSGTYIKLDGISQCANILRPSVSLNDITSIVTSGDFKTAVDNGYVDRLNIKDGDYFTGASGYKYILAHYNYFFGSYTSYSITSQKHYTLIVDIGATHNWNSTATTVDGYASSAIHSYLTDTVLTNVESDMATFGLTVLSHQRLYSSSINSTGYNRFGTNSGCSNGWAWSSDQKISLMTENQVYGGTVWSSSGYDTGEAKTQLEVFKTYNVAKTIGNKWFWLRDVASASIACMCGGSGDAGYNSASNAGFVLAIISVY